MKNILVIGGSGFIGSNLVNKLLKDKNLNISLLKSNSNHLLPSNHKIFHGDLSNLDLIKIILINEKIDTVIHLASNLIPSSDHLAYFKEFETIVKPTVEILPFLSERNIKLVYFSTGGAIYKVKNSTKFKETDELEPLSYYGFSKLIVEEAMKFECRKSRLRFLILRPSNPYGIGQKCNKNQGLIATCINKILTNETLTIWGDGSAVRDYIYIDDLIDIVEKILKSDIDNQTFNIGSGEGTNVKDIIYTIEEITNKKLICFYEKKRTVDIPNMILDVTKTKIFKTKPFYTLKNGIELMYNFEKYASNE